MILRVNKSESREVMGLKDDGFNSRWFLESMTLSVDDFKRPLCCVYASCAIARTRRRPHLARLTSINVVADADADARRGIWSRQLARRRVGQLQEQKQRSLLQKCSAKSFVVNVVWLGRTISECNYFYSCKYPNKKCPFAFAWQSISWTYLFKALDIDWSDKFKAQNGILTIWANPCCSFDQGYLIQFCCCKLINPKYWLCKVRLTNYIFFPKIPMLSFWMTTIDLFGQK